MKLQSFATLVALAPFALGFPHLEHFPPHRSLAGLSPDEVHAVVRSFDSTPGAQPLPPPIQDTSTKLVNDKDHPFRPEKPGDIRGPCPALNTLASHGYLPRNGVASPAQLINAVQEGFNMGYNLAAFTVYSAFVNNGNHLTNLMSIGANTTADGEFTRGLNTHGTCEGDASSTRGDHYFGNNYAFNETLFKQLEHFANQVGNGHLTLEAIATHKYSRINDSIAHNPTFFFESPRWQGALAEAGFPVAFFVNKQKPDTSLPATVQDARSFYQNHRFPDGFYRRQAPFDKLEFAVMFKKILSLVKVPPGHNEGAGNYVVNHQDDGSLCYAYHRSVSITADLYRNPTPELKAALKANLATLYKTLQTPSCPEAFPYGK